MGAALLADGLGAGLAGKSGMPATNAVVKIMGPAVGTTAGFRAAAGLLPKGASMAASGLNRAADTMMKAGVAKDVFLMTHPKAAHAVSAAQKAAEFAGGYLVPPTLLTTPTWPETAGMFVKWADDHDAVDTLNSQSEKWEPYVGRGMR